MGKKGFTLVEMILAVTLIVVISLISLPSIMDILKDSKEKKYVEYEKILRTNLEMYNIDKKADLWKDPAATSQTIDLLELKTVNPDINIGNCDVVSLIITKNVSVYKYYACIECYDEDNALIYESTNCTP